MSEPPAPNFWRPPQISTGFQNAASECSPRGRCESVTREARKAQQTIDPQNDLARLPDVSCREALISAWPTGFQMTSMCRTEWLADSIAIPEVTFLRILRSEERRVGRE